jgi:hypothetical protein
MHQVPGLRTKQIRWHSTRRPRSQPTFGHILNLKIAHSARRVWKESLFVMDSFTGPVHGSGQTGTQLIRCWNSGIQLRARDREFGLGCTLRTQRWLRSPRLNAPQVTTTRRSCPSRLPAFAASVGAPEPQHISEREALEQAGPDALLCDSIAGRFKRKGETRSWLCAQTARMARPNKNRKPGMILAGLA